MFPKAAAANRSNRKRRRESELCQHQGRDNGELFEIRRLVCPGKNGPVLKLALIGFLKGKSDAASEVHAGADHFEAA